MLRACIWMFFAIMSFCLLAIGARELSSGVSIFQTLFTRSIVGVVVVGLVLWQTNQLQALRTQRPGLHLFRHLAHFAAQYGWFFGLGVLPLAQVFAIEFTVPIWTAIIASVFLGEHFTKAKLIALIFGTIGAWIIVQPSSDTEATTLFASLVVLSSAIFFSIAHVSTKALAKTEPTWVIVFFMCLIQMLASAIPASLQWIWPTPDQWFWLGVVSFAALAAHFSMTRAMMFAHVTTIVTIDYLRLPMITLVGILFYDEPLTLALLLGAILMITGNLVSSRAKSS